MNHNVLYLKKIDVIFFVFFCSLLYADYTLAETFKLKCFYKKGNSGASLGDSGTYIVDKANKLRKTDCDSCTWDHTLYWADDYIVRINSKSNMAFSDGAFLQSRLKVLNLEKMVQYSVTIDVQTFRMYDVMKGINDFDGAPIFAVSECTRQF